MLVYDLDGNLANWKMGGKEVVGDKRARSYLHKAARKILKDRFPTLQVLEEVTIKVRRNKTLFLDFYLPLRKLAIEVNGEQHYSFNSHFHSTTHDFIRQRKNDISKLEWCDVNDIELIVFKFDEQESWVEQV